MESPLARSVVDLSTTGVDANKSLSTSTTSGGNILITKTSEPTNTIVTTTKSIDKINNSNGSSESPESASSDGTRENPETRDRTRHKDIVSDVDRSDSTSPSKIDRKPASKKPSFKPVSLNKQFLKDTSATSTTLSLLGAAPMSKGSPSGTALSQSTPRPMVASKLKLVRSGNSQTSRPSGTVLGGGGISRTESQPVWNKNQPIPPPPKKEFTDEELSKKYGIHLASRLGSEDTSNKEAKWADIDDDDDDWVPETIEWTVGMKTSSQVEEKSPAPDPAPDLPMALAPVPLLVPEPAKEAAAIPQISQPKLPAPPTKDTISPGPKTLVTQKQSVKPIPTTGSSAPRPSPWAKILPPQAVSPIPVSTRPPEKTPWEEIHEPSLVKEVSADVYDRSWRDRNSNQNSRELFNSHTGKMEPVPDERNRGGRSAARSPLSKPAVLQRPLIPVSTVGPAEPSAAFQTGRTSHRPDDYRRRRASSNVSGGSGSLGGRRQSFTRYGVDPPTPEDMAFVRNGFSYNNPFDDNNGPPARQFSGYGSHHPPFSHIQKDTSPIVAELLPAARSALSNAPMLPLHSSSNLLDPVPPVPIEPEEDVVAKQERIMREARELARKRRLEEEQREEAAKKERLRLKLEALEKLAKEKEEKEAAARKAEEGRIAAEKQIIEERRLAEDAEKRRISEEKEKEIILKHEQENAKAIEASIAARAEPRQAFHDRYVRQPNFVRSTSPSFPEPSNIHSSTSPSSQFSPHQHETLNNMLTDRPTSPRHPGVYYHPNNNHRPQPWKGGPANNNPKNNWVPNSGNPWGAVGDGSRQASNRQGDNPFQNYRYNGTNSYNNARSDRRFSRNSSPPPTNGPSPIGVRLSSDDRANAVNRWNALPDQIVADEQAAKERNRLAHITREAEEAITGLKRPIAVQPQLIECFKQYELVTGGNGKSTGRTFVGKVIREPAKMDTSVDNTTASEAYSAPFSEKLVPKGPTTSRPSRFFPNTNVISQHLGQHEELMSIGRVGSPPPPMSSDHPVHGDVNTRVQLPPSGGPPTVGAMHRPGGHFMRPQNSTFNDFETVQQKLLGLTHKHSSPQKSPIAFKASGSQVITPRSKPSFETTQDKQIRAPTVSLPSNLEESFTGETSILTIQDSEEFITDLFRQDFGSTPNVKIPRTTHAYNALSKVQANPARTVNRKNSKWKITTAEIYNAFSPKEFTNSEGIRFIPVKLPGGEHKEIPSRGQDGKATKKPNGKKGRGGRVNGGYSHPRPGFGK